MIRLVLIVSLIYVSAVGSAQDYYNRVIPFHMSDVLPNAYGLFQHGDDVVITSLANNTFSTLIKVDLLDNSLGYIDISDVSFSIYPNAIIEDKLFIYGKDRKIENDLQVFRLDNDFIVEEIYQYEVDRDYSFPTGLLSIGNDMFFSSRSELDGVGGALANLKKIDNSGTVIWDRNYGLTPGLINFREMLPTENNNILISAEVLVSFDVFHHLIKIDTSGNEIWRFIAEEQLRVGQTNQNMALLNNSQSVLNSINDRRDSIGYGQGGWYPFPPHLIWVDDNGEFIQDTILNSEFDNFLYLSNIEQGKGDYFFGHGEWRDPITQNYFSWLFKMSNDGEMIWRKRYQHPDYPEYSHIMNDIIEMDNGDIVALSTASEFGVQDKILLMRLNEHGCYGEENCPDELIYTDVYDIDISEDIRVYPNPTSQTITIESECYGQLAMFDMQGRKLLHIDSYISNETIDVSNMPTGVISYRLVCQYGVGVGTFVKN